MVQVHAVRGAESAREEAARAGEIEERTEEVRRRLHGQRRGTLEAGDASESHGLTRDVHRVSVAHTQVTRAAYTSREFVRQIHCHFTGTTTSSGLLIISD